MCEGYSQFFLNITSCPNDPEKKQKQTRFNAGIQNLQRIYMTVDVGELLFAKDSNFKLWALR